MFNWARYESYRRKGLWRASSRSIPSSRYGRWRFIFSGRVLRNTSKVCYRLHSSFGGVWAVQNRLLGYSGSLHSIRRNRRTRLCRPASLTWRPAFDQIICVLPSGFAFFEESSVRESSLHAIIASDAHFAATNFASGSSTFGREWAMAGRETVT